MNSDPPAAEPSPGFDVDVLCAIDGAQRMLRVRVDAGNQVIDALRRCGLEPRPGTQTTDLVYAIHGERVELDRVLRPGDRVEVLGALRVDPKEARRRRARRDPSRR